MNRISDDPFINSWHQRIEKANQEFDKWEMKFRCKTLEKYYEGMQTPSSNDGYVLNLIFSTWKTKSPSLLFKNPRYNFTPLPSKGDFDPESAWQASLLASDLVNTLVANRRIKFADNTSMALLDIGPYFGVIEVGYDATWRMNPNAGQPSANTDDDPEAQKIKVTEPAEIPEEEWIYVKRIPADTFRVFGNNHWDVENNAASGYFEWWRRQDLPNNQEQRKSEVDIYVDEDGDANSFIKVWKIWDHRKKVFFIYNETDQELIQEPESYKRYPIKILCFDKRRKGFYPIPVFWNWKPAQDDYNEARQQLQNHRRRSKRLLQAVAGSIEEEEKIKAITGPDLTIIEVKQKEALSPIQNPNADRSIIESVQISKDDFNIASGTSAEARGQADRVTATQANITARFATIREVHEREITGDWLNSIGEEILAVAIESFTLPVWIQLLSDSPNVVGMEAAVIQQRWQLLNPKEIEGLGSLNFVANVSVESLSPLTNQEEKVKFMEFMALLQQYPVYSLHPTIVREMAGKCGYRNEHVIQALQQMAMLQLMSQVAQGQQNLQSGPAAESESNVSQRTSEQMAPPTEGEIENQLANQGVPA